MRYFVSISYRGKDYSGWQIQQNAVSIEGTIENAFKMHFREDIDLVGAGRTDAGVNAFNLYAHFDSENENILINLPHTIYKINAILPSDIVVHDIFAVHPDAHARFDATSRTYKYFVHTCKDAFSLEYSCSIKYTLDVEKMNTAAKFLLGKQDFSCFEKTHGGNNTSICEITEAYWELKEHNTLCDNIGLGQYLTFTITANRFLRNMVRAIVGSLIEIGRGKKEPEWIKKLIISQNRCEAGQSVPGNALFLHDIKYPYINDSHKYMEIKNNNE